MPPFLEPGFTVADRPPVVAETDQAAERFTWDTGEHQLEWPAGFSAPEFDTTDDDYQRPAERFTWDTGEHQLEWPKIAPSIPDVAPALFPSEIQVLNRHVLDIRGQKQDLQETANNPDVTEFERSMAQDRLNDGLEGIAEQLASYNLGRAMVLLSSYQ